MAYQPIEKPIPKYFNGKKVWGKRDCKDFKPFFLDRRHCKLADNCRTGDYHCESISSITNRWGKLCTGIKIDRWQKIVS